MQKLAYALMLPLLVAPAGVVLLAGGEVLGLYWLAAAGRAVLFTHLPLVFALSVALAFTDWDGMAALGAVLAHLAAVAVTPGTGALGGILVGGLTAFLFHAARRLALPDWLGPLSGKGSLPLLAALGGALLGWVLARAWPPLQSGLDALAAAAALAGLWAFVAYAALSRLLLPVGLHPLLNAVVLFHLGSYTPPGGPTVQGELARFYAGDPSAGYYTAGFFVLTLFTVPAIALAIGRARGRSMRTALLTAVFLGVTEPVEFEFLRKSRVLYALHTALTALAVGAAAALGVRHFGFALPLFVLGLPYAARAWLILPLGVALGAVTYALFRQLYEAPVEEAPPAAPDAAAVLAALGGAANLLSLDACMSRLRLTVRDQGRVDAARLRDLGAAGVVRLGGGAVQVVVGGGAARLKEELAARLRHRQAAPDRLTLLAPLTGRVVPLGEVPDPVFSQRLAGDGLAIEAVEGVLVAPCAAKVVHVFPGGHAVGLQTAEGIEILLHIGLETVAMGGEGFSPQVEEGDLVEPGQTLVRFDLAALARAGKSPVSPVLVTSMEQVDHLELRSGWVQAGRDGVFTVRFKGA